MSFPNGSLGAAREKESAEHDCAAFSGVGPTKGCAPGHFFPKEKTLGLPLEKSERLSRQPGSPSRNDGVLVEALVTLSKP